MNIKVYQYLRIPANEYQADVSEFHATVGKLLSGVFRKHGYLDLVPGVTSEITKLAEALCMKIRGKPIEIKLSPHWDRYNADD